MSDAVLSAAVLVLNRSFVPIRITTARAAFTLLYRGVAHALDEAYEPYDFDAWLSMTPANDVPRIGTVRGPVRVPEIVILHGFNRQPRRAVPLTRRGVLLRDNHTCQYCTRVFPTSNLNLDHVVPRSRGGPSTWENLVTSCKNCNLRKGRFTPEECGMKLARRPVQPSWSQILALILGRSPRPMWRPFIDRDGHHQPASIDTLRQLAG